MSKGAELWPEEVGIANSKRNSQYFSSYLRKITGGLCPPPPSEARVNLLLMEVLRGVIEIADKAGFSGCKYDRGNWVPLVLHVKYIKTVFKNSILALNSGLFVNIESGVIRSAFFTSLGH